jgi:hypothetical protein
MSVPLRKDGFSFNEEHLTTANLAQGKRPAAFENRSRENQVRDGQAKDAHFGLADSRRGPVFAESPTSEERQALSDALTGLTALSGELESRSHRAVCRICEQPFRLEDRKLDENGMVVHESCYIEEMLRLAANFQSRSENGEREGYSVSYVDPAPG